MSEFDVKRDLRGIVASLHTPFTAEDRIDPASLVRLIDHCAEAGCCGILVAAVAGEVGALRRDERKELLAVSVEAAEGRLAVIAGISAEDLETSAGLAEEAAEFGIPMGMWQPPQGLAGAALQAGLTQIAERSGLQIMLQDLDWFGGGLPARDIASLAESQPALTAVKIETNPAGPKYSEIAQLTGGRLHLSGGWAVMQMLDGLARGLDAFIPSGLLPWHVRLFSAWQRGEIDRATGMFERMLPVLAYSNQHIDVSGRFWKQVRVAQGIFTSAHCRLPRRLDPVQQSEADRLCARVLQMERAAPD